MDYNKIYRPFDFTKIIEDYGFGSLVFYTIKINRFRTIISILVIYCSEKFVSSSTFVSPICMV